MQIHCVVRPKSKVDSVSLNPDHSLRIKIKAIPVRGSANEYLTGYLSKIFNVPQKCIQIVSGFTGSHKKVNIVDADDRVQDVLNRLVAK